MFAKAEKSSLGSEKWLFISFPSLPMPTGTIKKKLDKGFGFIAVEGSNDVFFHSDACNGKFDSLQVGASVTFDVEQSPRGPKAVNVVAA